MNATVMEREGLAQPITPVPRVWVMMGHRAGDNAQVLALAEALGWPFEIKRFVYRPYELATNLLLGPTLAGVVREKSSPIEAPWPDLIISAGRRNEPICRWIQKQAQGRVRLIHIGRPWAKLERFDLVITTPQYRLPPRPNVLHNETCLHRVTPQRLAEAGALWAPRLASLPPPYVAVLIGGNSGPYVFDEAAARRLARDAGAMARALGGSLLITTSARTDPAAIRVLEEALEVPFRLYRWTADDSDNPYFGFLALARRIIVTADSISMISEACATSRPVYLFDLGEGWSSMRAPIGVPGEKGLAFPPSREFWHHFRPKAFVYRQSMRLGPKRMTRDIRIIHRRVVASGRAAWLGEGDPRPQSAPPADLDRAVARVRALFEQTTHYRLSGLSAAGPGLSAASHPRG